MSGAVDGVAFFITSNQKTQGTNHIGRVLKVVFHGYQHRGEARLHVSGAATDQ
jgi:uncharacterized membrane protein